MAISSARIRAIAVAALLASSASGGADDALAPAQVTATAEVTGIEGRTITFRVAARDEIERIGGGTHQRVVVSVSRFDERVQRKLLAKR